MTTLGAQDALNGVGDDGLSSRWTDNRVVGGIRFVVATPGDAAADVVASAMHDGRTKGEHIHLANAFSIALADRHPVLAASAFSGDAWNLPDGKPLSWVSAWRGDSPSLSQVRGPQFFLDVCRIGQDVGLKHYLLGGAPDVLVKLQQSLEERFPDIDIVGVDSPPFREPTSKELKARDRAIRRSGAHIVWVGLGTPKQDIEAARLAVNLPIVAVAIGAGFDYAAGTLRHAPRWMSKIGMEWFFRLITEPRRLWKRYLFGNARFLWTILRRDPTPSDRVSDD